MHMLKSVVVHDIPINHIAAMERWYYRDHAPEINRRFGPWLARHDSYLPVDAPADARTHGYFNWRVTEGYWRELPASGPRGNLAFTLPPVWPRVATAFFPAQPTEDFLGGQLQPHERQVLRWYQLLRFPQGVDTSEAERWYLEQHAPQLSQLPKLYRAFSTRVSQQSHRLPGEWPPSTHPPAGMILPAWDRLTELWFETFDDWREFIGAASQRLTRPAWATHPTYPFLTPHSQLVSSFLLERPSDEFWRDSRGYM
jgi:hypothetical protein